METIGVYLMLKLDAAKSASGFSILDRLGFLEYDFYSREAL